MSDKLRRAISKLSTEMIVSCVWNINKKWDEYTEAERMTRARLLDEFEKREGEDAADLLMDQLDDAIEASLL